MLIDNYSETVRVNFNTGSYDIAVERLVDGEWKAIRLFNEMSDDYAHTNAKQYARWLVRQESMKNENT